MWQKAFLPFLCYVQQWSNEFKTTTRHDLTQLNESYNYRKSSASVYHILTPRTVNNLMNKQGDLVCNKWRCHSRCWIGDHCFRIGCVPEVLCTDLWPLCHVSIGGAVYKGWTHRENWGGTRWVVQETVNFRAKRHFRMMSVSFSLPLSLGQFYSSS